MNFILLLFWDTTNSSNIKTNIFIFIGEGFIQQKFELIWDVLIAWNY